MVGYLARLFDKYSSNHSFASFGWNYFRRLRFLLDIYIRTHLLNQVSDHVSYELEGLQDHSNNQNG